MLMLYEPHSNDLFPCEPDFHTDFQENFTIQLYGKKKWTFRKSTAVSPLRACTPHFKAAKEEGTEKWNGLLGVKQQETDLCEQQLKVLRLGDPNFAANQYEVSDKECPQQDSEVVTLGPGDVLYHPAGLINSS
jgi:ribosomal protein L16 Arg81 hydroxylase